jgi:hypothetical protein
MLKYLISIAILSLFATSCSNRAMPCPSLKSTGDPNMAMVEGKDGAPVSTYSVKLDKNGRVKKKKFKRMHQK